MDPSKCYNVADGSQQQCYNEVADGSKQQCYNEAVDGFVCVEVLRPSQPNGVM